MQSCKKFSAVFGATSILSSITTRPTGLPAAASSKNTFGLPSAAGPSGGLKPVSMPAVEEEGVVNRSGLRVAESGRVAVAIATAAK